VRCWQQHLHTNKSPDADDTLAMSFSLKIMPQPKREARREPIAKALAPGDQCSDAFLLTSVGKPTSCLFFYPALLSIVTMRRSHPLIG
jgi:hypothetical protein